LRRHQADIGPRAVAAALKGRAGVRAVIEGRRNAAGQELRTAQRPAEISPP
jgi:hypothetical protein